MPTAIAVYIHPRLLASERDLIWCEAEEVAIFFVKFSLALDKFAGKETVDEWEPRSCPELGAWKLRQWVKVQVVDGLPGGILPPPQLSPQAI